MPGIGKGRVGEEERNRRTRTRMPARVREVVGTIAVTTLVAWYTLLVVHTHGPSPCLPRFSLSHSRRLRSFPLALSRTPSAPYAPRFLPVCTAHRCNSRARARGVARTQAWRPLVHTRTLPSRARTRVACACSLASLFSRFFFSFPFFVSPSRPLLLQPPLPPSLSLSLSFPFSFSLVFFRLLSRAA